MTEIVIRENRFGVEKEYVRVNIGTSVVTVPKRVRNPVTERTENLAKLSDDGYCQKFLALLAAQKGPAVINLKQSPVLSFDTDRWAFEQRDGQILLTKRESESALDEMVLDDDTENNDE